MQTLYVSDNAGHYRPVPPATIISMARTLIEDAYPIGRGMSSPSDVETYLSTRLGGLEHEVFTVMFLNSQNQLLGFEEMFRGTINQASVYPREVAKEALRYNAAAVILSHNHPSGVAVPSQADIALTETLKKALDILGIAVLDHIIVGCGCYSFADHGLI